MAWNSPFDLMSPRNVGNPDANGKAKVCVSSPQGGVRKVSIQFSNMPIIVTPTHIISPGSPLIGYQFKKTPSPRISSWNKSSKYSPLVHKRRSPVMRLSHDVKTCSYKSPKYDEYGTNNRMHQLVVPAPNRHRSPVHGDQHHRPERRRRHGTVSKPIIEDVNMNKQGGKTTENKIIMLDSNTQAHIKKRNCEYSRRKISDYAYQTDHGSLRRKALNKKRFSLVDHNSICFTPNMNKHLSSNFTSNIETSASHSIYSNSNHNFQHTNVKDVMHSSNIPKIFINGKSTSSTKSKSRPCTVTPPLSVKFVLPSSKNRFIFPSVGRTPSNELKSPSPCQKRSKEPVFNLLDHHELHGLKIPSFGTACKSPVKYYSDSVDGQTDSLRKKPVSFGNTNPKKKRHSSTITNKKNIHRRLSHNKRRSPFLHPSRKLSANNQTPKNSTPIFCIHNNVTMPEIHIGRSLGAGGFGSVYLGTYGSQMVAIKRMHSTSKNQLARIQSYKAELCALRIRHPNIVRIITSGCTDGLHGDAYIVMEYAGDRNLTSVINDPKETIDFPQRIRISLDIANALKFIHTNSIVHLDVKPANVIITSTGRCKLTDFGCCQILEDDTGYVSPAYHSELTGTFAYRAPEVLKGDPASSKADIFSLAVTMWQLVTRSTPYSGQNQHIVIFGVVAHHLRPHVPDCDSIRDKKYTDIFVQCWASLPNNRPTAAKIIQCLKDLMKCQQ